MITKWKLQNFKSVRNETELTLRPLTIFAGPNSSGKSTWIQSILLISQTLASKVSSRSVVLNGGLTRLGQFDDLRSFSSNIPQISVGWECKPVPGRVYSADAVGQRRMVALRRRSDIDRVTCNVSFDIDRMGSQLELQQLQPRLSSCDVSSVTKSDDKERTSQIKIVKQRVGQGEPDKLRKLGIESSEAEKLQMGLEYDVSLDAESLADLREYLATADPVGCALRHFLPFRIDVRYDRLEEKARNVAAAISEESGHSTRIRRRYQPDEELIIPQNVIDFLNEQLGDLIRPVTELGSSQAEVTSGHLSVDDWYERIRRVPFNKRVQIRQKAQELSHKIQDLVREGQRKVYSLTYLGLPDEISDATNYLDSFFSNSVKYLGPLRDEPKPLYPLSATIDPSDVGLRGEYTAAVFDLHRGRRIEYIPSENFSLPSVNSRSSSRTLEEAVLDWLHYLGVAEGIQTTDRGKLGHELKVTTQGVSTPHDLTHVGVGVSQVLPILVTCLLADYDDTLIIEQPELHLHPRVQTLLADFLLSISLLGKQCIIETHSEYVINRLRLRIASSSDESLSNLTKIYFVEKREGISHFRDVVVNKYGAILDWPEGFFDQSQSEVEDILKAASAKRKKDREVGKDA